MNNFETFALSYLLHIDRKLEIHIEKKDEKRGDEKKSEQWKYITMKHTCVTLRTSCLNSRAPLTLSSNAASLR